MKKISLITKEKIIEKISSYKENSDLCVFVQLNRIRAFPLNTFRNNLNKINSKLLVAKNSLVEKTFSFLNDDKIKKFLNGETGLIFTKENTIVETCKLLIDFKKETEFFKINGALYKDRELSVEEIENLAKLPSKEILLGMAVSALASPLTSFVNLFNSIIANFLLVLEQIKNKKNSK
ncbi:MAG: 50S ribosomal protein L10 [Candidatus Omnitrophica bacterium]|nr:50S ribosomal protein L10 [Candidatus Omnitrophota bacterium]MCM8831511.1 50S ribosomal protein L10 [Candidatus Omnitrophota bacterium]